MRRKDFLTLGAVGGVGALAGVPLAGSAKSLPREVGEVIIEKIEPFLFKRALFVKITSSEGIAGWGEANTKNADLVMKLLEQEMIERIEGKSIYDTEYLWNRLFYKNVDAGPSAWLSGAIAGIDNALWDLKGRLLEQPVYHLLGGPYTDRVKVYGSYGRGTNNPKSDAELAQIATDFVEKGYEAVKVRMQIRQLNLNPDPDPSLNAVKAIREAIGDRVTLFFDANNGYTASRAIQVARKLYEHHNIASLEEPVAEHNYAALARVSDELEVAVTGGEHEYTRWMFRDLITLGKVDMINPDLLKAGGVTECQKIAMLASAFDIPVMFHNVRPTLATATMLHLVASIPNAAPYQEFPGFQEEWGLQKYFKNELIYQDGYLKVPTGPGFGLEPDEAAMRKDKLNR